MRIPALLALLLILNPAAAAPPAPRGPLVVQAVPLDASQPARRRIGKLTFLDGWALRSRDAHFGGISALHVEGDEVLAVSDEGYLIRFPVPGRGPVPVSIRPLPAGPAPTSGKPHGDSESLIVSGNRAWIGFERVNGIWSYAWPGFRPLGSARPPAMRKWPGNEGPEAMVRLGDGRFLIFSEGQKWREGATEVMLFDRDPADPAAQPASLGYRAPRGYQASDAAPLPDGRLLIVNRRYVPLEGVSVKLTVAATGALRAGAILEGREIADFRAPVTVDNFEAVSVTKERGRTIVWIASDDNFSALQRTLLMKFALEE